MRLSISLPRPPIARTASAAPLFPLTRYLRCSCGHSPRFKTRLVLSMATLQTKSAARLMMTPSVVLLLLWSLVPLAMTIYYSTLNYNLLTPGTSFVGFLNYEYFLSDPAFFTALFNTLLLVGGALLITIIGGIAFALLLDQPMYGRGSCAFW